MPRTNTVNMPHRVLVHDARPIAADLSLDREGFELVGRHSAARDFYDEDELRRVYYPEAESLVAEYTGASRVITFDHTIRRRQWGAEDRAAGMPRQPATRVHNDYTERSAPQRIRDLMGDATNRRAIPSAHRQRRIAQQAADRPHTLMDS